MNSILEYKGYLARIEYSSEDKVLFGKIEGISDLVNFESADINGIEQAFHDAADDYLRMCAEIGKEPGKAYKGSFNIRIAPELHKQLAYKAFRDRNTLNQEVENAIRNHVRTS